jgi:predicted dehydrogenase
MGPVRVGLAGGGYWARVGHAAVLAAGPETVVTAVWARRAEAAREVAARHDAAPATSFDELVEQCDAVAFAVPPHVQARLAPRAALAGRALLLEKPLAADVAGAQEVAAAVRSAGVASLVALSFRFGAPFRRVLGRCADATGASVSFVSDGGVRGPFAHGWRITRGVVLDAGPHALDLAEAMLGPIVTIDARGERCGRVEIEATHQDGRVTEIELDATAAGARPRTEVVLHLGAGRLAVELSEGTFPDASRRLRETFADLVRRGARSNPLDARRGVALQKLVAAVECQLPIPVAVETQPTLER